MLCARLSSIARRGKLIMTACSRRHREGTRAKRLDHEAIETFALLLSNIRPGCRWSLPAAVRHLRRRRCQGVPELCASGARPNGARLDPGSSRGCYYGACPRRRFCARALLRLSRCQQCGTGEVRLLEAKASIDLPPGTGRNYSTRTTPSAAAPTGALLRAKQKTSLRSRRRVPSNF